MKAEASKHSKELIFHERPILHERLVKIHEAALLAGSASIKGLHYCYDHVDEMGEEMLGFLPLF